MQIVECVQGSPEWFAARAGVATASRFADVLAKIKSGEAAVRRNYRIELIVERLTGKPMPSYQSPDMRIGIEREPLARAEYEAKTGNLVTEVGFCRHDEIAAGASPDGLIGTDGLLEIKCPNLATHFSYIGLPEATAPAEYVPQIQGLLWITGRKWCDFVSYNPDYPKHLSLVIRSISRDDKFIATLEAEVRQFVGEVDEEMQRLTGLLKK